MSMNSNNENLQHLIGSLSDSPGVYQFLNNNGEIIYVGKAKNLKKRVASYFSKIPENRKVAVMISKICDVKTIVVDTESDALLLENNLIKEYQPRYNVLLKDDKTYPWIVIRNESFPRVYLMRNPVQDGSQYFGPYASVRTVRSMLELVKQLYKLRSCNLRMSDETISKKKNKVCLEYHIGNCKGVCQGLQTKADYDDSIAQIREILKGNIVKVIKHLKKTMLNCADNYRFEEAEEIKNKILHLEKYRSKSAIVNPSINNVDVFSYEEDVACAYVNCLHVVDGAIVQVYTVELIKRLDEQPARLLGYAITNLREKFKSQSHEIVVPFNPDVALPDVVYTIPEKGDKKELLELSNRNVKFFVFEKKKRIEKVDPDRHVNRILETVMQDLHLRELPVHIECFDNSNIQGNNPVSACVVFRNARPCKKEYRRYNIKTVVGANDVASIEEVTFRRYSRLIEENESLPQLIVIDGGKGQLNAALRSLKNLELDEKISVISIAERLEVIYLPGDSTPIYLNKRSESLKLIQQLRDEAHRFSNSFHRDKRSQSMLRTKLMNIDGIGQKTIEKILHEFKSTERLKTVSLGEMEKILGKQKANLVFSYFAL